MSEFVSLDVSILVQTFRFSSLLFRFSYYFHFSAIDVLNDGSAVLCACWTPPLLLSPLRLQHDGSSKANQRRHCPTFFRPTAPRPTCPARLPEIALRQPRSPWNAHFYVVVFRRSNTTNSLFFAYFGLRSFPPLELSLVHLQRQQRHCKSLFFFCACVFR